MKNAKEYKRRAELARDITESEAYRSYPMWGVNYTDTIRGIQRRNRKLTRTDSHYMQVEGCDNRCVIRVFTDEGGTHYTLESYDTDVCEIYCGFYERRYERLWDGWTPTTMKHVNAFRDMFGFTSMCKYDWLMTDVEYL